MRRHKELLSFKKPKQMELFRKQVTPEQLNSFYANLGELLEYYCIHPALYANMDETMLKALKGYRKVLFPKDCPVEATIVRNRDAPIVGFNNEKLWAFQC